MTDLVELIAWIVARIIDLITYAVLLYIAVFALMFAFMFIKGLFVGIFELIPVILVMAGVFFVWKYLDYRMKDQKNETR